MTYEIICLAIFFLGLLMQYQMTAQLLASFPLGFSVEDTARHGRPLCFVGGLGLGVLLLGVELFLLVFTVG